MIAYKVDPNDRSKRNTRDIDMRYGGALETEIVRAMNLYASDGEGIEVKSHRKVSETGRVAIELSDDRYSHPMGLRSSTADWWVHGLGGEWYADKDELPEVLVWIRLPRLKLLVSSIRTALAASANANAFCPFCHQWYHMGRRRAIELKGGDENAATNLCISVADLLNPINGTWGGVGGKARKDGQDALCVDPRR